jgi:hypothetical protein
MPLVIGKEPDLVGLGGNRNGNEDKCTDVQHIRDWPAFECTKPAGLDEDR